MILSKHLIFLFLLIVVQYSLSSSAVVKRDNNVDVLNLNNSKGLAFERNLFGENEEKKLEQEILKDLNHLSPRKQREIFDNLEKQQKKINASRKNLVFSETENLSPVNLEELKSVRKTIKASNSSLPSIRNKRTLNFLLLALARAMGYTLAPTNPNAEWIPRQQSPSAQSYNIPLPPCPQNPPSTPSPCAPPTTPPCSQNPPSTPPPCAPPTTPPCSPNPPSTPPPCAPPTTPPCPPNPPSTPPPCAPPTTPPCPPNPPSIPPPCAPPTTPPCSQNPPSTPPPCAPPTTPPCPPNPPSKPPPCAPPTTPPCRGSNALIQPATVPPNQIDANTISYPYRPARTIPLFNFAPLPAGIRVLYPPLLQPPTQQRSPCIIPQPSTPCSVTPSPSSPPCRSTSAPPLHPCAATPPSSFAPCGTTPLSPPPCKPNPPSPCSTTPAPSSPPCATTPMSPQPPCGTPPSCGSPQTSSTPPLSESSKRGSILLEYDDPVRIQIFSNDKKYLPASGSVYSGHDNNHKEDWHSYFFPDTEKNKKKDEDSEETEEEHIEQGEEEDEEESDKAPGQLKHYEEEDERTQADKEEEEKDESETSLSIVKKPIVQGIQKADGRRLVTTKTQTSILDKKDKKNEEKDSKYEKSENEFQKVKKPKRKKWIRIMKKQRKTKTDLNPQNRYESYTSDTFSEPSHVAPKYYGKRGSQFAFDSHEKDISDFSDDSSSRSSEDVSKIDLKKVIINNKEINSPELLRGHRRYEFNFNPYVLEPEDQRRKKLEKAVEKYVEDYVEKQLGDELIKNTGIPKTTVFEFAPLNGPKIQTITTTVAKTSQSKNLSNFKPQIRPEIRAHYKDPTGNAHTLKRINYGENFKKSRNFDYDIFASRKPFL